MHRIRASDDYRHERTDKSKLWLVSYMWHVQPEDTAPRTDSIRCESGALRTRAHGFAITTYSTEAHSQFPGWDGARIAEPFRSFLRSSLAIVKKKMLGLSVAAASVGFVVPAPLVHTTTLLAATSVASTNDGVVSGMVALMFAGLCVAQNDPMMAAAGIPMSSA